jgi:amidophosphoribosyltransferase
MKNAECWGSLSQSGQILLTECISACFTGRYPEDVSGAGAKNKFDEKIHK